MAKKSDYGSTKWIYKLLPKIIFIVFIAVSQRATFPNVPKDSQVLLLCYTTYEHVPKGNRGATENKNTSPYSWEHLRRKSASALIKLFSFIAMSQ